MWQKPRELLLIGCLTESIWTPRSESDVLTPRTNSLTVSQKVVSPNMNGTIYFVCWTLWICPCFFRSHFRPFVSEPSRYQKPMSKRGQDQNFGEGSATAKPKPVGLVQAKARPRKLSVSSVSRTQTVEWENSTEQSWRSGEALTNVPDVNRSSWKAEHDCDTSDSVKQSQVRKQENAQSTEAWKQAKVTPSDGSFRRRDHSADSIDRKGIP